jgi:hypothetical protein
MTSVITDWRTSDEVLPDVAPGKEFERRVTPQKFVVLWRIQVLNMALVRLEIGTIKGIPFELDRQEGATRVYRPNVTDESIKKRLIEAGGAVAARDAIAVMPAIDIRVVLRNDGSAPVKPRVALIVQEEIG